MPSRRRIEMGSFGQDAHDPNSDWDCDLPEAPMGSRGTHKTAYEIFSSSGNNFTIGDISDDEDEGEKPIVDSTKTWAETARTALLSTVMATWVLAKLSTDKTVGQNLFQTLPVIGGLGVLLAQPYFERKRSEAAPTVGDWLERCYEKEEVATKPNSENSDLGRGGSGSGEEGVDKERLSGDEKSEPEI